MVLRQLFRHPAAYSTYIAASPSLWWNDNEVLADEAAFPQRVKTGALHLKLLITSAADERYRGSDPAQLAVAAKTRMVDNAAELSARFAAVMPENLQVTYTLLPGKPMCPPRKQISAAGSVSPCQPAEPSVARFNSATARAGVVCARI